MKKTIYALFMFAFACSLFFAKSTLAVVPAPISLQDLEIVTVTGKIESISRECSSIEAMATIIIIDKMGKKVTIEVKADTVIYDKDGKTTVLDKFKKGDKVIIEYREARNTVQKAETIQLTK
jgi:hypothetical protein